MLKEGTAQRVDFNGREKWLRRKGDVRYEEEREREKRERELTRKNRFTSVLDLTHAVRSCVNYI